MRQRSSARNWVPKPPYVDVDGGFFFSADTIGELAEKIQKKYQRVPMPPQTLEETVGALQRLRRVRRGPRFRQAASRCYKIAKPPFYAAWCDAGDPRHARRPAHQRKCQVVDMEGEVIPGLYCGGESAGGFSMHGLARCTSQGFIAGRNAAAESKA